MKAARPLCSLALLVGFSGIAHAQNGCARLSWDTCDPWVQDKFGFGGGIYRVVESLYGLSGTTVGTETQIRISFGDPANGAPDAWRFDNAGCQTLSRLSATNSSTDPACPAMGSNPVSSIQCWYDSDNNDYFMRNALLLRLTTTFDEFAPSAATRYTAWQIAFDHSHSKFGPTSSDKSYCGNLEQGANFLIDYARTITSTGQQVDLASCDVNQFFYCGYITWDGGAYWTEAGGNCGPVRTLPATWGKLKGMYR
jgi:hypothetical protein